MSVTDKVSVTGGFRQLREAAETGWGEQWRGQKPVIMVGTATCGRAAGALEVLKSLKQSVKKYDIDCDIMETGCLGHCYAEPMVLIRKPGNPPIYYGNVNPIIVEKLVRDYLAGDDPCLEYVLAALEPNDSIPFFDIFPRALHEKKLILQNCGLIDPGRIEHYLAKGGYAGLVKALEMSPAEVIEKIEASGLRGRGGAGYPTGQKWRVCFDATGKTKYVIGNADEGDPGAFMDRNILESDPHSVIEGLITAGYAVGAEKGWLYIRAEYPLAIKRVEAALKQARKSGFLGKNILHSGFSFDIKVFKGSGAFVCGEETALIASMEGRPGLPSSRPPYPAEAGLHGKPTLINNVKTLAYVRHIMSKGSDWFRKIGTPESPGTAVFALAGDVINTGMVEVPTGTSLKNVIFEVGSGIPGGGKFKSVQIGGPSGGCLPETELATPVDFDSLQQAGAMMGSGGMVVLNTETCMVEMARYMLEFTQRESCGKCTFCRLGTKQMLTILERITRGDGVPKDIPLLKELAGEIKAGSLCNLGKTAPNPVLTTLRYFLDEYEAHINEKRCPALMCRELISFYILPDKCERTCEACVGVCTVDAIYANEKRIKVIDQEKCVKCGLCIPSCPPQYDAIVKVSPPDAVPAGVTE